MERQDGARRVGWAAVRAFLPVVAMAPFSLLALAVFWIPIALFTDIGFVWTIVGYAAVGILLFVRPFQVWVLTPILGARRPDAGEAERIATVWAEVMQANALPPDRYVVRVLPSDELNAFACGGHLVVVTAFATHELSTAQLRGVLAHELSHHLGMHTVAITVGHWLAAPVIVLARVGFYLQNVATAAATTFGRRSSAIAVLGRAGAAAMRAASSVFTVALRAGDTLGNLVGHELEFEADAHAVRMGFGPELASALRNVLARGSGERPVGWRARLAASHPAARTRVARIEAFQRRGQAMPDDDWGGGNRAAGITR